MKKETKEKLEEVLILLKNEEKEEGKRTAFLLITAELENDEEQETTNAEIGCSIFGNSDDLVLAISSTCNREQTVKDLILESVSPIALFFNQIKSKQNG